MVMISLGIAMIICILIVILLARNVLKRIQNKEKIWNANLIFGILIFILFSISMWSKFDIYNLIVGNSSNITTLDYYVNRYDTVGARILLSLGVSPNSDSHNQPAEEHVQDIFHDLIQSYRYASPPNDERYKMLRLMIQYGADVNKVYIYDDAELSNGIIEPASEYTPLMLAAYCGDYETVRILVENGADMNAVSEDGRSAYIIASSKGEGNVGAQKIVKYLVEQGADTSVSYQDYLKHNFEEIEGLYYSKDELDALEKLTNENKEFEFDRKNPSESKDVIFRPVYEENNGSNSNELITKEVYATDLELVSECDVIDLTSFKCLYSYKLCGEAKEVKLPIDGRSSLVPMYSFHLYELERLILPPNVDTIHIAAFSNCENLSEITVQGKKILIHSQAFYWEEGSYINSVKYPFTIRCSKDTKILYTNDCKNVPAFREDPMIEYIER